MPSAAAGNPLDLLSQANVRIDGAAANDNGGSSVAAAGDVNGDGREDVIVGAPAAGNNGRPSSGSTYVLFSSADPSNVDLASLSPARGFRIDGAAAGDRSGSSVAVGGDFNGDGRDDMIVGALRAGNNGREASGSSYLVYSTFLPDLAYREVVLGSVGVPLSVAPKEMRATGARTITVSPPLPPALSLDHSSGRIAGTPTTPGITRHRVRLEDATGFTETSLEIAIVNAQGPSGDAGQPGRDAAGTAGPPGRPGRAGRDARVNCRLKTPKRSPRRPKVICRVRFAAAGASFVRASLRREGRVYARASTASGAELLRLRAVRPMAPGRYVLRVAVAAADGATTMTAFAVTVER